jgi:ferredoxin
MAESDPYRALARRLDQIPNGFPATASGAELRLLAHLYTLEEAAMAARMRLTAESAAEIAARTGEDPKAVHGLLKSMARKGLIRVTREGGGLRFGLLPFVVGIYEMQGYRLDAELAELVEAYMQEAFPAVLGARPALHRVIPVEETVQAGVEILPYEKASEILDQAAAWGVVDCICRWQQRLLGKGCDRPLDVCMVLSRTPGAFDQAEGVRALTREEATATLKRAEEAGLVHSTTNTRAGLPYLWYICNCCSCCCGVMRGIAEFGLAQSIAHSAFWAVVDEGYCTGCETCLERCQFGALSVEDGLARVDRERCAGCGLCATVCPNEALSLEPRPGDRVLAVPPDNDAWWAERARNRGIDLGEVL